MAKLRHIAVATKDPEKTSEFYKKHFEMEVAGRIENDLAQGYYLTDGVVSLAILKFKIPNSNRSWDSENYTGIHHFGFKVEGMEEAQEQIISAGATKKQSAITDANGQARTGNVEVKFTGPDGITVDLSETGWAGASKD